MRTEQEKQEMIKKLNDQKKIISEQDYLGFDNWNMIDNAILIIQKELKTNDIYDRYDEANYELLEYCLLTADWLSGFDVEHNLIEKK